MGGKGNSFRRIIGAMPEHDTYIETHLGGGSVMLNKRPSPLQIGIDADADVIAGWKSTQAGVCELVHGDAVAFLRSFDFHGDVLVYCDPPHPWTTRRSRQSYRHDYTTCDHERLLETVAQLPCSVMISGADDELYNRRLSSWRRLEFRSGARRGARAEVLWMNFPEPLRLHDPRHRGRDFRDRERLKRQLATLTKRVERMPATERMVFARWFAERYPDAISDKRRSA